MAELVLEQSNPGWKKQIHEEKAPLQYYNPSTGFLMSQEEAKEEVEQKTISSLSSG